MCKPSWEEMYHELATTLARVGYEKQALTDEVKHLEESIEVIGFLLADEKAEMARLREALNPRVWTQEMNEAWHRNIPDTLAAFSALRVAAMKAGNT